MTQPKIQFMPGRQRDPLRAIPFFATLAILCAVAWPRSQARGEGMEETILCRKSAGFLMPSDSANGRHYSPELDVKVLHLALDVTPDFKEKTVKGEAKLRFKAKLNPVSEVVLDAVRLQVKTVSCNPKLKDWQATDDRIVLTFAKPLEPDQEAEVTINYSAEPKEGLYFRTPEMGYKDGDTHLFSQGEEQEARHWYPCFDSLNMKFTSEVTCHVPEGMEVISNGRLVSRTKDSGTGLVAVHWSQDKPHANYLITLCAGYFKKLEAKYHDLPLAFYVPASEAEAAAPSFRHMQDMLEFFEQETGVTYPWAKYDQVCVNDFVAGGMENTSATTLMDSTLFTDATENLRDSDSLEAHELAHQWFGDLVTCKDWCHTWLNEGFATYYEVLYRGHSRGRDEMLIEFLQNARQVTAMGEDNNPIVRRNYGVPREIFNYLAYPKGGWVLRMLRAELGDELFRRGIKTYLDRFKFGNVGTEDLRAVFEEISGRSFDQFFDQWVYHGHFPELDAVYTWDASGKLAKFTIRQTQKLSDNVMLFRVPLKVRFKGKFGTVEKVMKLSQTEENFTFALDSAPEIVRLDPDCELLARISFNVPQTMLVAQLADKADGYGRYLAAEQFARKQDNQAFTQLKQALARDTFLPVRLEAISGLRSIHSDDVLTTLLEYTHATDARIRSQVMGGLGSYYRESAYAAELDSIQNEKNPAILATSLRSIGSYVKPEVHDLLLKHLDAESFHNEVGEAAISAMRTQEDSEYVEPLLNALRTREKAFTGNGFNQGVSTLVWLARESEKKDDLREFFLGLLNHKRRSTQLAAISALGTLGDIKAIPALEALASAGKESPTQGPAERAVSQLRSVRRTPEDPRTLRSAVLELEKSNKELRKDLDELKKKLNEKTAPPAPKAEAPKASKAPKKTEPAPKSKPQQSPKDSE